jgi:Fe-S-cluster containining protein
LSESVCATSLNAVLLIAEVPSYRTIAASPSRLDQLIADRLKLESWVLDLFRNGKNKTGTPAPTLGPDPRNARGEAFGYVCGRCGNCCRHWLVPVNAYESARLARALGVGEAEFRARFTRRGAGRELAHQDGGACIFLGASGCGVYADRPLTCRLYPLRRSLDADGNEAWTKATPHPQTLGSYAVTGTIADFVDRQDAGAHIRAADEAACAARPRPSA